MSNQDTKKATTSESQESPQVTFALFAYNQERYIREAVEGAFSQTYQPLEIILSDDCSTDRTFEVMKEMAEKYKGPHSVRLNRNLTNMGIVRHVFFVASLSSAKYLVVAAGDDISKPNRTDELVTVFVNPRVSAVCSGYDVINENGLVTEERCLAPASHKLANYFPPPHAERYVVLQGSTAAYRKSIFFDLGDMETGPAEDNFLNFLIYANGGTVEQLTAPLVLYRQHSNAVHHKPKVQKTPAESETHSYASHKAQAEKLRGFQSIAATASARHFINERALEEDLRQCEIISAWPTASLSGRIHSVLGEVFFHKSRFLKWQIARLFGHYPNYQPKIFLGNLIKRNAK